MSLNKLSKSMDILHLDVPEDDRIKAIGDKAMAADHTDRGDGKHAGTVGFVVETYETPVRGIPGPAGAKLARYVTKVLTTFPGVEVISTGNINNSLQYGIVKRRPGVPRTT